MVKITFKIFVIPLLYLISLLPFWLLRLKSLGLYFWVYYVFGYRKKVVFNNLRNSFPEKTEYERKQIAKQFYLHFCEVIFETIKLLTVSKEEFKKRCVMDEESQKVFQRFFDKNQSIVGVMGHCGNWEWGAIAHQIYFSRMITGVYHPLSNKNFDELMLKLRGRFGGDIVAMNNLFKRLLSLKQQGVSTTIGLIADQTPPPESAYWSSFLNQDTPFFNGPEKLAKKFNYPVIYMYAWKTKPGFYRLETKLLCESPRDTADGEITELIIKSLEHNIQTQPQYWLWSHRRWKHKRPTHIK